MATDQVDKDQDFITLRREVAGLPTYAVVSRGPVPASRRPVVLVHGLALSGRYLMPTAKVLRRRYRVYVPDLPGFGDSGKPRRILGVPQLADSLAAWMQAAGLDRAHLLANSFGCQIIADLAARYPQLVDRLVLQGPTTTPSERSWLWQWIRWRQNSPYNPPAMGDIASRDYDKCGRLRAILTFRKSLQDRVEDKLPRIEAPALVVRGQHDPICRPEWAEQAAELLPDGRLVIIPGVAHTLVFTSPEQLSAVSVSFFEEAADDEPHIRQACGH
jgi:2-hydroxy-6-oxonona-2,4-dienedioate hydrolase